MKFKVQNIRSLLRDHTSIGQRAKTVLEIFKESLLHFKKLCIISVARSWHSVIAMITLTDSFMKKGIFSKINNSLNAFIFSSEFFQ